jgi:hypothetical protein
MSWFIALGLQQSHASTLAVSRKRHHHEVVSVLSWLLCCVTCCVAAGVVYELPVPDHKYPVASAFNDMSLHCFSAAAGRTDTFGLKAV